MNDDEAQTGGRVFFSSAGRSLVDEDEIELTSVGVDIGSSTSHLVFSKLELEQRDARYIVVNREVLYESEILLTPYVGGETIDSDALGAFIAAQYEKAAIKPDEIDTGALILTGVAVRRSNARAIGELFAEQAGKFVAVSAGDNLETTMAAYGSGAVTRSESGEGSTVMNVDMGGGTTKIAICQNGKVVDLTAIDVGARLVAFDDDGKIVRVEEAGKRFASEVGIELALGETLSENQRKDMAERMAERLFEVMKLEGTSKETESLMRLDPLTTPGPVDAVSFSGGVSEFVYGYAKTSFGDLGPDLAAAIRAKVDAWDVKLNEPVEGIRATVIGASQYTIQVSGSTIFVSPEDILPLRNVPVIAPPLPNDGEEIDPDAIAEAVQGSLKRLELKESINPVALCFRWEGSATFKRLNDFCQGVLAGFKPLIEQGHPVVLVSEGDVGGLLGIHCKEELKLDTPIVSIDGIELKEFDYVDIGAMLPASGAVPVVIKSLVFPTSSGLGKDFSSDT